MALYQAPSSTSYRAYVSGTQLAEPCVCVVKVLVCQCPLHIVHASDYGDIREMWYNELALEVHIVCVLIGSTSLQQCHMHTDKIVHPYTTINFVYTTRQVFIYHKLTSEPSKTLYLRAIYTAMNLHQRDVIE